MSCSSPAGKGKTFAPELKRSELSRIRDCLDKAIPKRVFEYTMDWEWTICPNCRSILDREYVRYCDRCGQALSWYGSIKYAVRIDLWADNLTGTDDL